MGNILEEYKKQVEICLEKNWIPSMQVRKELMEIYTADFPMFYQEKWKPNVAATAMVMSY